MKGKKKTEIKREQVRVQRQKIAIAHNDKR